MQESVAFDESEGAGRRKDLRSLLDDYERKLIQLALDAAGGHQRRAAASLGILASTLSEKMKRLGLRTSAREWPAGAV
jgi:DNA-binding NtrC family response regulator